MAYLDLYVRTGGSNLNAGTTDTDSPSITATCTYNDSGSGQVTFTASSGTPFSGASVGQWASILSGGETLPSGTSFISQISAIGGSGASITVYTENGQSAVKTFFGQFSNTNNGVFGPSGTVTVRVGGAWGSIVPLTTGASGGSTGPNTLSYAGSIYSIRVNVKSGTYSSSTSLTLATPPTAGKPLFIRGYATTAGDLDNVANPGTHPVLSFSSTANLTIPNYTRLENIDITATGTANPLISVTSLGVMMTRCRVTATGAALTISGTAPGFNAWACYFTTTSTTVALVNCNTNNNLPTFNQCVFQGGLYNVSMAYNGSFNECLFRNSSSHLVYCTQIGMISQFYRCTFYNSGASSDAINLGGTNAQYLTVAYCIFANISRYAINVTDTAFVGCRIIGPDYYSITSGQLNGVYESYQHAATTETASPFTSASGNDFTLVTNSSAASQSFTFEMP
jgi:hypothetical protein